MKLLGRDARLGSRCPRVWRLGNVPSGGPRRALERGSGEGGGGHLFQASPGALCSNCLSRANKAAVVEVGLVCGDRAILSNIGGAI